MSGATLSTGTRVTDGVTLIRPLGRGGMGSVWIARHAKLDCEVAVKFASAELAAKDPSILARFKREAALSAKLKSPHVVKTFDHGVMEDGRPYIVMELLDGETLGDYLVRLERLAPRHVVKLVAQVAAVLEEAHGLGVIHRDIKPDNVFLIDAGYDFFVKVLDFGIAKQTSVPKVSDVTGTGAIVGTPEYMSPEQLLSTRSADHRSDLWSLAVLAYHALFGRVPFTGETLPSLSLSICNADYDAPSEVDPELPAELDAWFARALSPEPADRFQSASTMAEALRAVLLGDEPMPESRPRPASRASDGGSHAEQAVADTVPHQSAERPPRSASFSGAYAELPAGSNDERKRTALRVTAVAAVALLVTFGADAVLRRSLATPATGAARPFPSALGDPWEEASPGPEEAPAAAPPAATSAAEPSDGAPAASSTAYAEGIAEAPAPVAQLPRAKPLFSAPKPAVSSSASAAPAARPGCEEPFELDKDGTMVFKPGCG